MLIVARKIEGQVIVGLARVSVLGQQSVTSLRKQVSTNHFDRLEVAAACMEGTMQPVPPLATKSSEKAVQPSQTIDQTVTSQTFIIQIR